MEILIGVDGLAGVRPPVWPRDWPVPAVGTCVSLYGWDTELEVLAVVWLPQGSDDDTRAHVRVLLGRGQMPH